MEFISNFKEKSRIRREEEIRRMANDYITLSDSGSKLFIAFQGNSLIDISESWSASDILVKLQEVRNNFINSKLND